MAFLTKLQVIRTGTIFPSTMHSFINLPSSVSDFAASLNKSPQQK